MLQARIAKLVQSLEATAWRPDGFGNVFGNSWKVLPFHPCKCFQLLLSSEEKISEI